MGEGTSGVRGPRRNEEGTDMSSLTMTVRRAAVGLVAVGTLAGGATAVASAAPAGAATPSRVASAPAAVTHQRECARLRGTESRISRYQARWAARTAKLAALAAKAQTDGNTNLARYWQRVVTRRDATATKTKARQAAHLKRMTKHIQKGTRLNAAGRTC